MNLCLQRYHVEMSVVYLLKIKVGVDLINIVLILRNPKIVYFLPKSSATLSYANGDLQTYSNFVY